MRTVVDRNHVISCINLCFNRPALLCEPFHPCFAMRYTSMYVVIFQDLKCVTMKGRHVDW
jgi:hypothetical protein